MFIFDDGQGADVASLGEKSGSSSLLFMLAVLLIGCYFIYLYFKKNIKVREVLEEEKA